MISTTDPESMTAEERRLEVASILARGLLRRLRVAGTAAGVAQIPVATDPRLPSPGTAITRKYKGRTITVTVLPDGFEYKGERYRSLTAVAKVITGSHVNGFRFFKLEGKS